MLSNKDIVSTNIANVLTNGDIVYTNRESVSMNGDNVLINEKGHDVESKIDVEILTNIGKCTLHLDKEVAIVLVGDLV
jgi:hypothetical protein